MISRFMLLSMRPSTVLIFLAISSVAQAQDACESLFVPTQVAVKELRRETHRSILESPNYLPVSDFIAKYRSPVRPIVESKLIQGFGKIRSINHVKLGSSVVEWVSEDGLSTVVLFSTREVLGRGKTGRLDSVRVSKDGTDLEFLVRSYDSVNEPIQKYSRKLPLELPDEYLNKELLANYRTDNGDEGVVTRLKDGTELIDINYGINASTDIVLRDKEGDRKIIFSSFDEIRNGRDQIVELVHSPDERFIVAKYSLDGSIDRFTLAVYDRTLGKTIGSFDAGSGGVLELKDTTLRYHQYVATPTYFEEVLDLTDPALPSIIPAKVKKIDTFRSEIAEIGNRVYYVSGHSGADSEGIKVITKAARARGDDSGAKWIHRADGGSVLKGAYERDGYLIVRLQWGGEKSRLILDLDGNWVGKLNIPECCSLKKFRWKTKGEVLALEFESAIQEKVAVEYNIKTNQFSDPTFLTQLLTADGHEYVSEIVETTSADGTRLPIRITRRKDLEKDGSHPVYMTVYGGFGTENSEFSPKYDLVHYRFLQMGGIMVSPAIRGGGEFGEYWHKSGQGLLKFKSYEDTAAAAEYMIQGGFTRASKIVLTGASNGGLVSAASALARPELFGLVIPINGPFDLENAEKMDSKFRGWTLEYGDNEKEASVQAKKAWSPLRLLEKDRRRRLPEFFIINGEKDSRVNPQHSQKLVQSIQLRNKRLPRVSFLATPNSGHWNGSVYYQKAIGWHVQSAIWTKIYDYLGWTFEPSTQ